MIIKRKSLPPHIAEALGIIKRKSLPPHIAEALGRKKNVIVTITEGPIETFGTWWDGGSRSTYHAMNLNTGFLGGPDYMDEVRKLNFGHEVRKAIVSPGTAIVVLGISSGKTSTPRLYVHPKDRGLVGGGA